MEKPSKCPECRKEGLKWIIVKKEGINQGREMAKCVCGKFWWHDSRNYSEDRNIKKSGACYRCGRWGCDAVDCDYQYDFYGNLIPEPDIDLSEENLEGCMSCGMG